MKMDELKRLRDEDELAEQGRRLIAGAVAQTRAPLSLRERLEADRAAAASPRLRRRWRPLAWAAGAVAAVGLVAVLVVGGGGSSSSAPSVFAVAAAGAATPTAGAPRQVAGGYVAAQVGGVRFPDWRALSWPATGQRTDHVGARTVRTVTYTAPDGTAARYSVVDGPPLPVPGGGRTTSVDGETYHVLVAGGDRIVTWRRGGRTCVLRAPKVVPEGRLVSLAAWEPA
jgi:hypothetical protein